MKKNGVVFCYISCICLLLIIAGCGRPKTDYDKNTISVSIEPEIIAAGEASKSTITASLTDIYGTPVPDGTKVQWITDIGTISPASSESTTKKGRATAIFTAPSWETAKQNNGRANITVVSDVGVKTTAVRLSGPPGFVDVCFGEWQINKDGAKCLNEISAFSPLSDVIISARVLDILNVDKNKCTPVANGTIVTFSSSDGILQSADFEEPTIIAENTVGEIEEYKITTKVSNAGKSTQVTSKTRNGIAYALLKTSKILPDTKVNISASSGTTTSLTDNMRTVTFTAPSAQSYSVNIEVNPTSVMADGRSFANITASIFDSKGAPAADLASSTMYFTASYLGQIDKITPIDKLGKSTAILIAPRLETTKLSSTIITAWFVKEGMTYSNSIKIKLLPILPNDPIIPFYVRYITLTAKPTVIAADGKSTSILTAYLTDTDRNPVPDNTRVFWSADWGTIITSSTRPLTKDGYATAVYMSPNWSEVEKTGLSVVTLNSKAISNSVVINLSGPPTSVKLCIDGKRTSNGDCEGQQTHLPYDSYAKVSALVLDPLQKIVADGTIVSFSTSLGLLDRIGSEKRLENSERPTIVGTPIPNSELRFLDRESKNITSFTTNGYAYAVLHNTEPKGGTAELLASVGTIESQSQQIIFTSATGTVYASTPYVITISANPTNMTADGKTPSVISANLKIALPDGTFQIPTNLQEGYERIYFEASNGQITPRVPIDNFGNVTAIFTSPKINSNMPGSVLITAKFKFLDNGIEKTVSNSIKIGFLSSAWMAIHEVIPTNITVIANPTSIPADGRSEAQLMATVTDQDNISIPDGTKITWTTTKGIITSHSITRNGMAIAILTSDLLYNANDTEISVTVHAEVNATSLFGKTQVTFHRASIPPTTGDSRIILVSVDKSSIHADGLSTATVQAFLRNEIGSPVDDGTPVYFCTTKGTINSPAVTKNGKAVTTLFSDTSYGTAYIKVTDYGGSPDCSITSSPYLKPGTAVVNFFE